MSTRAERAQWLSREVLLILVILLLGCIGLYWSEHISPAWLGSLLHELSIALVIAAVLAILVDRALKYGLARDAFRTAFGYLLPEELRGELQWIYDQKLLCVQHNAHYELGRLDDGSVLVRCTVDRTFRNVSNQNVPFTPSLAIDEWRHGLRRSRVLAFGYEANEVSREKRDSEIRTETIEFGVLRVNVSPDLDGPINVAPRQVVRTWSVYEEVMAANGQHVSVYGTPTLNPHVRLAPHDSLIARVDFGHRDKVHAKRLGPHVFQLEGVLLPNQAIRVEWRVKNQDEGGVGVLA